MTPAWFVAAVVAFRGSQAMTLTPKQRASTLALTGESTAALKLQLLRTASGTSNGVRATPRETSTVEAIVQELENRREEPFPVFTGTWDLLFSTSPGSSSGKLGPFVGAVTQEFLDETDFVNAVELGPLRVALRAQRKPIKDTSYRVTFKEMSFALFGQELMSKSITGGGVWKVRYVDSDLRIMDTPSLFVLTRQPKDKVSLMDVLQDPARFMEDED